MVQPPPLRRRHGAPSPSARSSRPTPADRLFGRPTARFAARPASWRWRSWCALAIVAARALDVGHAGAPRPRPQRRPPLELVSLRSSSAQGTTLTVSRRGHEPARPVAAVDRLTAVVFAFDRTAGSSRSGRAPLDFSALAPGDESPFVVTVPNVSDVARYRVSFRTGDRRRPAPGSAHESGSTRPGCEVSHALHPSSPRDPRRRSQRRRLPRAPHVQPQGDDGFRFKSGVELINVTATGQRRQRPLRPGPAPRTTSPSTRTTSGRRSRTSAPSACRSASASLLDTSGSMAGRQDVSGAQRARPLPLRPARQRRRDLLHAVQQRARPAAGLDPRSPAISRARSAGSTPNGGTAMYDAVAEAIPIAQTAVTRRRRCWSSPTATTPTAATSVRELKPQIRESEVLVYAIGIDGDDVIDVSRRSRGSRRSALSDPDSAAAAAGSRAALPVLRAADWVSADWRRRGAAPATSA